MYQPYTLSHRIASKRMRLIQFGRLEKSVYLKVKSDRYNNDVRESRARFACRAIHLTVIATITLPDHVAMELGTLNAENILRF